MELGVPWPELPAEASAGVSVVVIAPVLDTAEAAAELIVDPALRDAGGDAMPVSSPAGGDSAE